VVEDSILRRLQLIGYVLISCIANLLAINTAYSVELTTATTISSTNFSYDGQDLIVKGAVLTIDGSHQFNSVQLIGGARLSHSVASATKLIITSNTFFIDASSGIDLVAKGNLPTADVTSNSGGSYGGLGGTIDGTTNPVFGSTQQPIDYGIGGRGDTYRTRGGGAIKIVADALTLNGLIDASGEAFGAEQFFTKQGAGSGGSIWLDVGTLTGTGTIQVSGGRGFTFFGGGGGGGGRIAVYYKTAAYDFQNNIINEGGKCNPDSGEHDGQPGTIYLEKTNVPPIADAGVSLAVAEQSDVTLSGSATDADGTITSYAWTQLSGSTVSLVNANTATADFTAPIVLTADSPTVLSFRLTVSDNDGATAISDTTVGVFAVNAPPVANAGPDINVYETTDVTLFGTGDDSDGTITAYLWTQISGTPVTLINSTSATTLFTAPAVKDVELLEFRLTVTDNEAGVHSDDVLVTVNPVNTLPIAKIVNPGSVAENASLSLDGSLSNDPDADGVIISYNWTQVAGPAVVIFNATSSIATFNTPFVYEDTTLSFRLDILDDEDGAATATAHITVFSVNPDDDDDGMLDLWEIQFFGTLDHDGTADTDNDGATDLQEHDFSTDPTVEQQPGLPEIISPDDIEVTSLQPELTLANPNQHPGFPVGYEFEVYRDAAMTSRVTSTASANLIWTVDTALADNTTHYWRARAVGTSLFSEWVSSKFFVNTENDAPGAFNISYPQDGVWVADFTPTLSVTNSTDVDGDALTYKFEVYENDVLFTSAEGIVPGTGGITSWTVDVPLLENNWYLWRAIVSDEHGLSTQSSSSSMIFINTVNDVPGIPTLNSPLDNSEIPTLFTALVANNAVDPESEPLNYFFECDTVNTFDSINKQYSDAMPETPDVTGWYVDSLLDNTWYHWRVKASDGLAESLWMNGRFFVNQFNDAPGIPKALNPGDQAWVGSLQPTLEVYPAIDIDGDVLSYEFEVYDSARYGNELMLINSGLSDTTFWQLDRLLPETGDYYWRARAIDEHGLAGEWGDLAMFFADSDGVNDAPVIKLKKLEREHGDALEIHKYKNRHDSDKHGDDDTDKQKKSFVKIKWKDHDPDSNALISLYYDTDQYGEDGVLITQDILEDPDGHSDRYLWDISQMAPGIYFVYAVIDDGNSASSSYSRNAIIVGDGGGLPFLVFKEVHIDYKGKYKRYVDMKWRDLDNDSNAMINFYYDTDKTGFDGTLMVDTLAEDPDGKHDKYHWNASSLQEGKYYIYATISDGNNVYRVYAHNAIKIKRRVHHDH